MSQRALGKSIPKDRREFLCLAASITSSQRKPHGWYLHSCSVGGSNTELRTRIIVLPTRAVILFLWERGTILPPFWTRVFGHMGRMATTDACSGYFARPVLLKKDL